MVVRMSSDSPSVRRADGLTVVDTSQFVDGALGDRRDRPQPKREPGLPTAEAQAKSKGTDYERTRYVGRSDPQQATHYHVTIEEPLGIPVRVNRVRDPPLRTDGRSPDRTLEMNIGSVENARKLYNALGRALAAYDPNETAWSDDGEEKEADA